FPNASFVEFPVRRHTEEALRLALELCPQSHTSADREAVAQTTCGERDLLNGAKGWERRKVCPLRVERIDILGREPPLFGQERVEGARCMSFGQNEAIAVGHPCKPQEDQELGTRKRTPDVPSVRLFVHGEKACLY